jgi:hypothetical protein
MSGFTPKTYRNRVIVGANATGNAATLRASPRATSRIVDVKGTATSTPNFADAAAAGASWMTSEVATSADAICEWIETATRCKRAAMK